jgi:hypothetical protein
LWVIFALLDPDYEYGSGSTDLTESGSDPKPCYRVLLQYLMAADLKGVVAGRDLVGPDGTDPDDGAEDPRVRARQDPVLDGDLFE